MTIVAVVPAKAGTDNPCLWNIGPRLCAEDGGESVQGQRSRSSATRPRSTMTGSTSPRLPTTWQPAKIAFQAPTLLDAHDRAHDETGIGVVQWRAVARRAASAGA